MTLTFQNFQIWEWEDIIEVRSIITLVCLAAYTIKYDMKLFSFVELLV